jgi:hypothetical protein
MKLDVPPFAPAPGVPGPALATAVGTALAFLASRPASCPPSTSRVAGGLTAKRCHTGCVGSSHNWPL